MAKANLDDLMALVRAAANAAATATEAKEARQPGCTLADQAWFGTDAVSGQPSHHVKAVNSLRQLIIDPLSQRHDLLRPSPASFNSQLTIYSSDVGPSSHLHMSGGVNTPRAPREAFRHLPALASAGVLEGIAGPNLRLSSQQPPRLRQQSAPSWQDMLQQFWQAEQEQQTRPQVPGGTDQQVPHLPPPAYQTDHSEHQLQRHSAGGSEQLQQQQRPPSGPSAAEVYLKPSTSYQFSHSEQDTPYASSYSQPHDGNHVRQNYHDHRQSEDEDRAHNAVHQPTNSVLSNGVSASQMTALMGSPTFVQNLQHLLNPDSQPATAEDVASESHVITAPIKLADLQSQLAMMQDILLQDESTQQGGDKADVQRQSSRATGGSVVSGASNVESLRGDNSSSKAAGLKKKRTSSGTRGAQQHKKQSTGDVVQTGARSSSVVVEPSAKTSAAAGRDSGTVKRSAGEISSDEQQSCEQPPLKKHAPETSTATAPEQHQQHHEQGQQQHHVRKQQSKESDESVQNRPQAKPVAASSQSNEAADSASESDAAAIAAAVAAAVAGHHNQPQQEHHNQQQQHSKQQQQHYNQQQQHNQLQKQQQQGSSPGTQAPHEGLASPRAAPAEQQPPIKQLPGLQGSPTLLGDVGTQPSGKDKPSAAPAVPNNDHVTWQDQGAATNHQPWTPAKQSPVSLCMNSVFNAQEYMAHASQHAQQQPSQNAHVGQLRPARTAADLPLGASASQAQVTAAQQAEGQPLHSQQLQEQSSYESNESMQQRRVAAAPKPPLQPRASLARSISGSLPPPVPLPPPLTLSRQDSDALKAVARQMPRPSDASYSDAGVGAAFSGPLHVERLHAAGDVQLQRASTSNLSQLQPSSSLGGSTDLRALIPQHLLQLLQQQADAEESRVGHASVPQPTPQQHKQFVEHLQQQYGPPPPSTPGADSPHNAQARALHQALASIPIQLPVQLKHAGSNAEQQLAAQVSPSRRKNGSSSPPGGAGLRDITAIAAEHAHTVTGPLRTVNGWVSNTAAAQQQQQQQQQQLLPMDSSTQGKRGASVALDADPIWSVQPPNMEASTDVLKGVPVSTGSDGAALAAGEEPPALQPGADGSSAVLKGMPVDDVRSAAPALNGVPSGGLDDTDKQATRLVRGSPRTSATAMVPVHSAASGGATAGATADGTPGAAGGTTVTPEIALWWESVGKRVAADKVPQGDMGGDYLQRWFEWQGQEGGQSGQPPPPPEMK
eukprot:jgi/Chrzof1/12312/Cz06g29240.t1